MKPTSRGAHWISENGLIVWGVVVVLVVITATQASGFATAANLTNIGRQGVVLALVALAQYVIVLTGGADLSLAANVKITSILAAIVMAGQDGNLLVGIATALGVGILIGAVNAGLILFLRIEPFIVTLGVGALISGISLWIASTPQGRSAPSLDAFYGAILPGGLYVVTLLAIAVWVLVWAWIVRSPAGRHIYAVGGSPTVAALSGVRVKTSIASVYIAAGALGGVAGIITLAATGVGDPNAAFGLEFTSLAVVIIGGASLAGGRGRLTGLLSGVVLFAILGNIFTLLRVDVWYQQLLRGIIILAAAALVLQGVRTRRANARIIHERKAVPHGNDQ